MKKQEQILRRMAEIPRLTRGKLRLLRTSKSGRGFYNLQYWHGGRNNVKYVSDEQYDIYAEAIDGYPDFPRSRELLSKLLPTVGFCSVFTTEPLETKSARNSTIIGCFSSI